MILGPEDHVTLVCRDCGIEVTNTSIPEAVSVWDRLMTDAMTRIIEVQRPMQ